MNEPTARHDSSSTGPTVAIVGGGLAGLAAAAMAAQCGLGVELFERRKWLGGRADSFVDPLSRTLLDYCQHVALGCCRVLADFCRRVQTADCFEPFETIHLLLAEGRCFDLRPSRWLPAPVHLLPSLLRLRYLSVRQRLGILRAAVGLRRFGSPGPPDSLARWGDPSTGPAGRSGVIAEQTIDQWLRSQGQSRRAIDQFWALILLSALAETPDRIALSAAAHVLREGLFGSRASHALLVPRVPLRELFDQRTGRWLEGRGIRVYRNTAVQRVDWNTTAAQGGVRLHLAGGAVRRFDHAVLAVPPKQLLALLPNSLLKDRPELERLVGLPAAGIAGVHLWFDRPITRLPHGALVGTLTQWVFVPRRGAEPGASEESRPADRPDIDWPSLSQGTDDEWYCQAVISASHRLLAGDAQQTARRVVADLRSVFPRARGARLRRWRVIDRPAAVLALQPGIEARRPGVAALGGPVVLAGDWTATGWPATMEGAVRSGYAAIEAVLRMRGRRAELLGTAEKSTWPQLEG